jgi:hypothetical protein
MQDEVKTLVENRDSIESMNRQFKSVPEYIRNIQEHLDKSNWLTTEIRRVEGYLGKEHTTQKPTPQMIEDSRCIATARCVRVFIQSGESDKSVAVFLKDSFSSASPKTKQKRGRPIGSLDCDGYAVNALELRDSHPRYWTWPKLADELMGCKSHTAHTCDSECTARLKKSVARLHKYLEELGYFATVK